MEKQLASSDLMLSKTAHETVLRKLEQFALAARNIFQGRKNLENTPLDLDRAKNALRVSTTLETRNGANGTMLELEREYFCHQTLFRTLLMNIRIWWMNRLDRGRRIWRRYGIIWSAGG